MEYTVLTSSLGGKRNKIFNSGDIVTERDFPVGNIPHLIAKGFLKEKKEELIELPEPPERKNKKLKVAFVTGMWKRENIFTIFAEGIKLLKKEFPRTDIQCFVAGSEGAVSEKLVKKYGFEYVEVPNQPLGVKFNTACLLAKKWQPDYCMMLGSDDLIAPDLMKIYIKQMQDRIDYTYITDCFFYDIITKKSIYWGGYTKSFNKGHAAGIGRCISSRLMEAMHWQPWLSDKLHNLLDTSMDEKLKRINHTRKELRVKESNTMALDIKSDVNMTPFKLWDNTEYIDHAGIFVKHFNKKIAALICAE